MSSIPDNPRLPSLPERLPMSSSISSNSDTESPQANSIPSTMCLVLYDFYGKCRCLLAHHVDACAFGPADPSCAVREGVTRHPTLRCTYHRRLAQHRPSRRLRTATHGRTPTSRLFPRGWRAHARRRGALPPHPASAAERDPSPSWTEEEADRRRGMQPRHGAQPARGTYAAYPPYRVRTSASASPGPPASSRRWTYAEMFPSEFACAAFRWDGWADDEGYEADADEPPRRWRKRNRAARPHRSEEMRGARHGLSRRPEFKELPLPWFWWPVDEDAAYDSDDESDDSGAGGRRAKRKGSYRLGFVNKRRRMHA